MATIVTQEETPAWNGVRLVSLKQHSYSAFEQLALVPGVQGACICDNNGAILGMLLAGTGDRRLYERTGLTLSQCLVALQARSAIKEIELHYESKLLVARDLRNALIVVICGPDVNLPLLRMTLNVATSPLENDAELQRSLVQLAPSRAHTLSQKHLDASARNLLQKGGLRIS
jgi:hypothetical protein